MTLEEVSWLAQIAGVAGVILSLVFVGWQLRQNTAALRRNEHNATQGEWSTIRMAVAGNREIAELVANGLHGNRKLDATDQIRLEHYLSEYVWACFHIWDRTQRGVFLPGTFEQTAGFLLVEVLTTPRGAAWWARVKGAGFIPAYAADVDRVLAANRAGQVATPLPP